MLHWVGRRLHCLERRLIQAILAIGVLVVPVTVTAQAPPSSGAHSGQGVPTVSAVQPAEFPRVELYAAYSYLPETDPVVRSFSDAGYGVGVGATIAIHRYLGLIVDFDTHAWITHGHGDATFYRGDQHIRLSHLSLGPRFVARIQRLSAFGFPSVDLQWSDYSEQEIIDARNPDNRSCCGGSASAWGFGFGGGVDLGLARRIAVRLVQVNYSLGSYGEGPGRKLRLKTGLVVKFD